MCRKCKRWHSPYKMLPFSCGETVTVAESTIPSAGRGVFTKKFIHALERITYYDGVRLKKANKLRVDTDYAIDFQTPCGLDQLVGVSKLSPRLNSWNGRGVAQLINDPICYELSGRNVNCYFQGATGGRLYVVALRDIQPKEELFVSYGLQYWTSSKRINVLGGAAKHYAHCHTILEEALKSTVLHNGHIIDCMHAETTFHCKCIGVKPVCSAGTPECVGSRTHTITASITCTYLETKCESCCETNTIPCFSSSDDETEYECID